MAGDALYREHDIGERATVVVSIGELVLHAVAMYPTHLSRLPTVCPHYRPPYPVPVKAFVRGVP